MRLRIFEGVVALLVLIAGVAIVGALTSHDTSNAGSDLVTTDATEPAPTTPPGPTLEEYANAVALAQYADAVHGAELQAYAAAVAAAKPPAPKPAPNPAPVAPRAPVAQSTGTSWDRVAQCESGGNWAINTGNGYYGGLQMLQSTWTSFGGTQFAARPDLASAAQQIVVAERIKAQVGMRAWPVCGYR